jgi:hypothetical protein
MRSFSPLLALGTVIGDPIFSGVSWISPRFAPFYADARRFAIRSAISDSFL